MTADGRCKADTLDDERCKRKAAATSDWCAQHAREVGQGRRLSTWDYDQECQEQEAAREAALRPPAAMAAMAAVTALRAGDRALARQITFDLAKADPQALYEAADFLVILVGEAMHCWGLWEPDGPDTWWQELALRVASVEDETDA